MIQIQDNEKHYMNDEGKWGVGRGGGDVTHLFIFFLKFYLAIFKHLQSEFLSKLHSICRNFYSSINESDSISFFPITSKNLSILSNMAFEVEGIYILILKN